MRANAPKYLLLGLWLLFAVSAALALFVMFKAGCAGDPKEGSLGDPARVLELEGVALFPLLISAASGGSALGLASQSINRATHGACFALFALICLWFAGMQFEIWGVQSCFSARRGLQPRCNHYVIGNGVDSHKTNERDCKSRSAL